MIQRYEITSQAEWNASIAVLPGVTILQTWEWGQVKKEFGWKPSYYLWKDEKGKAVSAALFLMREVVVPFINWRFRTIYIPQGPLLDWANAGLRNLILEDIREIAGSENAVFLKIDPEIITARNEQIDSNDAQFKRAKDVLETLQDMGYTFSKQQIQFKNTAWLMLDQPEETLLAAMKQKARYNIRLADRKGVVIRKGTIEDIDLLYQMYLDTSVRDGFIIRPKEYYQLVWRKFMQVKLAVPLIAEVDGQPVAGLMLFFFADRSWYLYGMSTNAHREKMPNYLLQWEAIKRSKQMGCRIYDLWGAPDDFNENDSMWGVYRFKKGLGADAVQRIGAFDLPLKKIAYKIFVEFLPRIQLITRRMRKVQQIQELN